MTQTVSNCCLPPFQRTLHALSAIIDKAAAFATARKVEESVILTSRLAPDMFTFARQVQLACDFAKNAAARLAGVEPVKFEDTEKSFADLQARIKTTLDYIATLDTKAIDTSAERELTLPFGPRQVQMKGADYLHHFVLPNFYFHATAAYAILRNLGVELGKRDFMGVVPGLSA